MKNIQRFLLSNDFITTYTPSLYIKYLRYTYKLYLKKIVFFISLGFDRNLALIKICVP